MTTKSIEVWTDDETTKIDFPASYVVCWDCQGEGKKTFGHTSSQQIAWIQFEWLQMDEQFKEDYLSGASDKPCPTCKGLRVTLEVREPAVGSKLRAAWESWQDTLKSLAETNAIQRAEEAMGA